jgi:tetratricopeptide (TPR) repeat protein
MKPTRGQSHCWVALAVLFCGSMRPIFSQTKFSPADFESLSKRAAEARDSDHLDQAVSLYKQALVIRPKWAEGWWSLGTLEYDRNRYAPAARAFRQLIPLAPTDGTARVMLGLCEFELGQDEAALKHIEEGRSLGIANNSQLRRVMLFHEGVLLLRAGKYKIAQSSFDSLCKEGAQTDETLSSLGLSVLRISPKDAPPQNSPGGQLILRVGHAACLTTQKKFDEARLEYAELLKEYPDYPNLHYALGVSYVAANDTAAAVEEFKQEILNHPGNVNARLEIAATLYISDSAAALPYAEEAVKLAPSSAFAHYLLGLLLLDTDDYLKAIPDLEIAAKAFPHDPKVFFALGSAYSRAGRAPDAARARATFQRLNQQPSGNAKPAY